MTAFQDLLMGFSIALTPVNLLYALIGCVFGTMVGVLPGIGPSAGMALLIPLTYQLPATSAIIMLAAIYYGAMYGGTMTSVLLNVPGEAASAVTCLDGYQMAKQGRAGAALSIAAIGSFVGGTIAVMGLVVAAPLARYALEFGPVEFFSLMLFALTLVTGLGGKSMIKGLMSGAFGLLLGTVGMDPTRGMPRFTLDRMELMDGINFIPVIMGLFGVAEILVNAQGRFRPVFDTRMSSLLLSVRDLKLSLGPILRGTAIGFFMGVVPGVGVTPAAFTAYTMEKKLSKYPEKFGTGVIEGVASPESANNACANAALIPLFTLGIPGSAVAAILMGAFMINGLVPGPLLFKEHPDVAWGVIASMYIGNVILLVLNLPLIKIWVTLLRIPYSILFALVLGFMVLGAYCVNERAFDVGLMLLFGILGFAMRKLDFPVAPAVLTLILGPMMERALRRALQLSQGDFAVFVQSPISATLLLAAAIVLLLPALRFVPLGGVRGLGGADTEV